jgi:hypothetical protein
MADAAAKTVISENIFLNIPFSPYLQLIVKRKTLEKRGFFIIKYRKILQDAEAAQNRPTE